MTILAISLLAVISMSSRASLDQPKKSSRSREPLLIRLEILRATHDVLDLRSACQRVSSVESIILSVIYLRFFRLRSRFDTADPRILIQSSLKTRLLLRESFDFLPLVAQRHIPIGISEVVLCLPLIAVAFYASQGVRLFTSGL